MTTRKRWSRKEIAAIKKTIKQHKDKTLVEIISMLSAELNRPKGSTKLKVYEYAPVSRFQRKPRRFTKKQNAHTHTAHSPIKSKKEIAVDKSFSNNVKPSKRNGAILEITNIKSATFTNHKTLIIELI